MRFDPMPLIVKNQAVANVFLRLLIVPNVGNDPKYLGMRLREELRPLWRQLPVLMWPFFLVAQCAPRTAGNLFNFGTKMFAERFIAGHTAEEILAKIAWYRERRFLANLDILEEAVHSEDDAARILESYRALRKKVSGTLAGNRLSFSLKLSSFYSQADPTVPERAAKIIAERLTLFIEEVWLRGGHVYLDAEEYAFNEIYWQTFELLYARFGNTVRGVLQAYLRRSPEFLERLVRMNESALSITLRLVRGAYLDHECFMAQELGWTEPPVFTEKADTDRNFHFLFEEGWRRGLVVIPATHNAESIRRCDEVATANGWDVPEYQMLGGMGESLGRALAERGRLVRFYLATAYLAEKREDVLPYLVRRIVENSSQFSFLAQHTGRRLRKAIKELKKIPRKEMCTSWK